MNIVKTTQYGVEVTTSETRWTLDWEECSLWDDLTELEEWEDSDFFEAGWREVEQIGGLQGNVI